MAHPQSGQPAQKTDDAELRIALAELTPSQAGQPATKADIAHLQTAFADLKIEINRLLVLSMSIYIGALGVMLALMYWGLITMLSR